VVKETFSCFDIKHACDTDAQTDGNAAEYTRSSIAIAMSWLKSTVTSTAKRAPAPLIYFP